MKFTRVLDFICLASILMFMIVQERKINRLDKDAEAFANKVLHLTTNQYSLAVELVNQQKRSQVLIKELIERVNAMEWERKGLITEPK